MKHLVILACLLTSLSALADPPFIDFIKGATKKENAEAAKSKAIFDVGQLIKSTDYRNCKVDVRTVKKIGSVKNEVIRIYKEGYVDSVFLNVWSIENKPLSIQPEGDYRYSVEAANSKVSFKNFISQRRGNFEDRINIFLDANGKVKSLETWGCYELKNSSGCDLLNSCIPR